MPPSERVSIRQVRAASDAEWRAAWLGCDRATWFHSPAWAAIWSRYLPAAIRPAARRVEFSDGRSAVLPLCERPGSTWRASRALGSPAATYGGWIAERPLEKPHAELLFAYLTREVPGLVWRVNPWDPHARELAGGRGPAEETRALELAQGFAALERGFAQDARWGARRARREGVEIGVAVELRDWEAYFGVYAESIARWGGNATSRHGWELFAAIRDVAPEDARLWVARVAGEVIAGALVFYAPQHAAWWHSAARAAQFPKQPMNLLIDEILRDACAQGLAVFDMGPSRSLADVERFKASFGATALACPLVRGRPLAWHVRLRHALARRLAPGPPAADEPR